MDALATATRAAYQALVKARAAGDFGNTMVFDAVVRSVGLDMARKVGDEAVSMALDVYAENRAANTTVTL